MIVPEGDSFVCFLNFVRRLSSLEEQFKMQNLTAKSLVAVEFVAKPVAAFVVVSRGLAPLRRNTRLLCTALVLGMYR